jgi:enamine deaminase RidA (YjgF/YER057c/UK114 family)
LPKPPNGGASDCGFGKDAARHPGHDRRVSRSRVKSGSPLEPVIGFSRAVRDQGLVFVSATAAIWPDGQVHPEVGVQARRCLEIIEQALHEAGAALRDVVRTRVFLVDAAHGDVVGRVHGEAFGDIRPATGFIVVHGFLDPRWLVEIEADAIVGG